MTLTEPLEFHQTALLAMAVKPMPAEPCVTLLLETELNPDIAEVLDCEDAVFNADGDPHSGVKSLDLDASLEECRIVLHSAKPDGQTITCHPETIDHMRVIRDDDDALRLRFRVKVANYATAFCDLINETHEAKFHIKLDPNQIALDFSGDDKRAEQPVEKPADEDFLESLGIGETVPPVTTEPPPKRQRVRA